MDKKQNKKRGVNWISMPWGENAVTTEFDCLMPDITNVLGQPYSPWPDLFRMEYELQKYK